MSTLFSKGEKTKLLPERLVNLRKKRDETQEQTAQNLGLTRSRYSQYELGTRKPDPETLIKIADYFKVSSDYLLGRDEFINEEKEMYISDSEKRIVDGFRELDEADKLYLTDLLSRLKKNK